MSAELEASTVTPGSVAPEVSVTVPVICACADASEGTETNSASIARVRADLHISAPPASFCPLTVALGRLLRLFFRIWRGLVAHTMAARLRPVNTNSAYKRFKYALFGLMDGRVRETLRRYTGPLYPCAYRRQRGLGEVHEPGYARDQVDCGRLRLVGARLHRDGRRAISRAGRAGRASRGAGAINGTRRCGPSRTTHRRIRRRDSRE